MTVELEVVTTVSLASCSFGLEPAPQQSPISCATVTNTEMSLFLKRGELLQVVGAQVLGLLGILNPHELDSV